MRRPVPQSITTWAAANTPTLDIARVARGILYTSDDTGSCTFSNAGTVRPSGSSWIAGMNDIAPNNDLASRSGG